MHNTDELIIHNVCLLYYQNHTSNITRIMFKFYVLCVWCIWFHIFFSCFHSFYNFQIALYGIPCKIDIHFGGKCMYSACFSKHFDASSYHGSFYFKQLYEYGDTINLKILQNTLLCCGTIWLYPLEVLKHRKSTVFESCHYKRMTIQFERTMQ